MLKDAIDGLLHLYEDGALTRRDIIARLTKYTGSAAAAAAVLESAGLAQVVPGCPAGVQVPEDDPALINQPLTIHGEGGPLYIYQSLPARMPGPLPAVVVVHENRGLNEHIKDVNRRVAKAGYVSIAVDLLSRQGGTAAFPDPEQAGAAFNRTRPDERLADMLSALLTIRDQAYVKGTRLGAVGFCSGGGDVLNLAVNTDALSAAAVFYPGSVPFDQIPRLNASLLGIFAELDRGVTGRVPALLTALQADTRKRYELHIYPDVNHAFHNDTGARYSPAAACDAWSKTLAFLNRTLNAA